MARVGGLQCFCVGNILDWVQGIPKDLEAGKEAGRVRQLLIKEFGVRAKLRWGDNWITDSNSRRNRPPDRTGRDRDYGCRRLRDYEWGDNWITDSNSRRNRPPDRMYVQGSGLRMQETTGLRMGGQLDYGFKFAAESDRDYRWVNRKLGSYILHERIISVIQIRCERACGSVILLRPPKVKLN